jgi:hypothetical protein
MCVSRGRLSKYSVTVFLILDFYVASLSFVRLGGIQLLISILGFALNMACQMTIIGLSIKFHRTCLHS